MILGFQILFYLDNGKWSIKEFFQPQSRILQRRIKTLKKCLCCTTKNIFYTYNHLKTKDNYNFLKQDLKKKKYISKHIVSLLPSVYIIVLFIFNPFGWLQNTLLVISASANNLQYFFPTAERIKINNIRKKKKIKHNPKYINCFYGVFH
jgi:hypothetical protein